MTGEDYASDLSKEAGNETRIPAEPLLYVGIGASAGGLEALEAFFTHMPPDSGLAFIVVQHLSPDYKSLMAELLSKKTEMPVLRAGQGMKAEPGSVYLIPPKKTLRIFHGKLVLSDTEYGKGIHFPIDIFLHSLAEDQGGKSVAVILSGTGSDGMRGIRAIKEEGGMVMVQSEESAKFDGMPRSAISTGLADFILAPAEMPSHLLSFAQHPYVNKPKFTTPLINSEDGLTRVMAMLREKHKVDFTHYKPSTVTRRIERRMTVNRIEDLGGYVRYLETHTAEVRHLYRELLIGVTSFFRDREPFEHAALHILPGLFESKKGREVRMWTAGCSTGEEAYSWAILCQECMERTGREADVKIFATDIDQDALLHAGNGVYPENIAADLPPDLLAKYFIRKGNEFQIHRSIREKVVFAHHNLIKDPPFTNIDLVSCRNLLIYLQPVLQRKVLHYFAFSLNTNGVLVLGSSETTGESSDYYEAFNHKWKIYRSRGKPRTLGNAAEWTYSAPGAPGRAAYARPHWQPAERTRDDERILERFLAAMADETLPLSLIVNERMELLHVFGDCGDYFKIPAGKMNNDVTKMANSDLSIPLATGLQKAFKTRQSIRYSNIRVRRGAGAETLQLRVLPLPEKKGHDALAAVVIEAAAPAPPQAAGEPQTYDAHAEAEQRIRDLEQELQFTKENLQATIEELETSNEELQAANEELLASNEELQSTNEELQSVNEELHTVNAEYHSKILELTELTNDVDNLMECSPVGILLLDENGTLRKYSRAAEMGFDITLDDIGRPFRELTHRFEEGDPFELLGRALEKGEARPAEFRAAEGRWLLLHAAPYRIGGGAHAGLVATTVDVTPLKRAEIALKESRLFSHAVLDALPANIAVLNEKGEIVMVNESWRRFARENGLDSDCLGMNYLEAGENAKGPFSEGAGPAAAALRAIIEGRRDHFTMRYPCHAPDRERWFVMQAVRLRDIRPARIAVAHENITDLMNTGKTPPSGPASAGNVGDRSRG